MAKLPLADSNAHTHYRTPHPPLRPGTKYLTVEVITQRKSYYISCPLHPNTDPHCLYWCTSPAGDYLCLRQDSHSPSIGLHVQIEVKGNAISIHEALKPGYFQSPKA